MRRPFASWLLLGLVLVGAPGCKQGEGEPCEFTSDCEDGLTCVQSSRKCQNSATIPPQDGGTGVDATNDAGIDAVDADLPDAAPVDTAPVDAAPDA